MEKQETIDELVRDSIAIGDFLKLKNHRPFTVSRLGGEFHVLDKEGILYEVKGVEIYRHKNTYSDYNFELTYYKK